MTETTLSHPFDSSSHTQRFVLIPQSTSPGEFKDIGTLALQPATKTIPLKNAAKFVNQ